MGFEVKIIADSITEAGKRITTLAATYPRIILAEVNTHRMLSRNSASSRAIPWHKMKAAVTEEPFIPIKWGAEKSGMQTGDDIPEHMRWYAEYLWLQALEWNTHFADKLANIGKAFAEAFPSKAQPGDADIRIHKSIPNRLLEPWMWTTTLITATEWNNLFSLRCHPAAEVHFQKIATMIREAREASAPNVLKIGEWHLPYVLEEEKRELTLEAQLKVSTARCARVSFLNHEGKREIDKDIGLHDKLFGDRHASPFEHQAKPLTRNVFRDRDKGVEEELDSAGASGNFVGWLQYRKRLAGENVPG